jgi:hypothetical protein
VKTIATKVIDRLILVAYATKYPTDQEWDDYLGLIERQGIERTMQIIATDGGTPTAAQRQRLKELLAGRSVPVAVISRSPLVRGSVTTLSWFNSQIKAFPPEGLGNALAYLQIPKTRHAFIEKELRKLRNELEGRTP